MPTAFSYSAHHAVHHEPGHAERPERMEALLARLRGRPYWEALHHVAPLAATLDDARLVHTAAYLDRLQETVAVGDVRMDPDTYVTRGSLDAALEALGGVLAVTQAVLAGEASNGFAAVRPPGHHATPARQMGFCLLSNVAVAARWAQRHHGVGRLLVVDFDVHHGNGTQDVFYDDGDVLFMSTHQWPLWPGTGAASDRGAGAGAGATVNVPLPPGTGDAGYLDAFRRVLTPLALRFRPELVLVSAGYDAHWKDPLAGMRMTTNGFAALVREVAAWADATAGGRLVCALEGGYHAPALAAGVDATVGLLHDPAAPVDDPLGSPPGADTDATRTVDELASLLTPGR